MRKKVVISCGPIPARLDSVKFITNQFKGGLAFKTAEFLAGKGLELTVVVWKGTTVPESLLNMGVTVVKVEDVFDYYNWFKEHASEYDAFVMAAAVANLTPSNPYEGKFPSHNYKVGEKFNLQFEIAPRAIDIIKKVNPRCCLIGYKLFDAQTDEELIEIARHTLADAKANVIFANTPAAAKEKKIAVMSDNTTLHCTFEEHLNLMYRAIMAEYFRTKVSPLTKEEKNNPAIWEALATVKMFEKTFPGFGTVAIPVQGKKNLFATTSRGHRGEPVIVRHVDLANRVVTASGKATLNAPALWFAGWKPLRNPVPNPIVIHRHLDDPLYSPKADSACSFKGYIFPGTVEEAQAVIQNVGIDGARSGWRAKFFGHGDIRVLPIAPVSWESYYRDFPGKYFSIPEEMQKLLLDALSMESLEIGCNKTACTKYAYDAYVRADNATNLSWKGVLARGVEEFDLVVAKNSINYFEEEEICELMARTKEFVANTFLVPPEEKIADNEVAIYNPVTKMISHTLRLPDDSIVRHSFHAYTREDYERMGFEVTPYGKNSALLRKKSS